MELILIRHLKTPGNEKRQYIGSTDEDLSEQEVLNFKKKCKQASYPQVQQVIVSPMKRCIQTAELIYPKNQITQEVLLKECDFGIFGFSSMLITFLLSSNSATPKFSGSFT